MFLDSNIEKYGEILSNYGDFFSRLDKFALNFVIIHEDNVLGFITLDRISQMNEFKLGKLYLEVFTKEVYTLINKEFEKLLERFIEKEFYLKITSDLEKNDANKAEFLTKHGFVLNKKNNEYNEYKITKPIYLERRK